MNESSSSNPAFIAKLWEMVNNRNYDNLIQWCKDGTSFVIKDPIRFCTELLPIYYKHNNLASFSRQLNKYGFKKVVSIDSASLKNDKNDLEFSHPNFLKDYPELLPEIKRKVSERTKDVTYPNVMVKIANEVQQLQKKQDLLESKLRSMKNENTALWREHSLLRHKHQNLQKLLNKLIQFLLTLVQQTRGLNIKRINLPLMIKDRSQPTDSYVAIQNHSHNHQNNVDLIDDNEPEIILPDILDNAETANILKNFSNLNYSSSSNKNLNYKSPVSDNPKFVAVPLQEISPAIVYGKPVESSSHLVQNKVPDTDTKKAKKRVSEERVINIPKKIFVKSNTPTIQKLKPVPIYVKKGTLIPVNQASQISRKPVVRTNQIGTKLASRNTPNNAITINPEVVINLANTSQNQSRDIPMTDNDQSLPIICSPNGTQLSPGPSCTEDDDKIKKSNPVTISDQSLEPLQKDIDSHVGAIQSDLDILKDLLQGEGISLDASTLLGFLNEDPLSLNMPEAMGLPSDNASFGNELISYNSPSLLDIVDNFEDNENPDYTSLPTPTLNTPKPEYFFELTDPSPSKQITK